MVRRLLLGIAALAFLAPLAQAQTADEVIAKYIKARGGMDKLKAVHSVRMTGKIMMGPGMEAPMMLEMERPNKMRMEFTVQGMTGVQAFDGKQAWMMMPFMGKKDPEAVPAEESKDFEEQADIDGPLVDYKAKGHQVELMGKEPVEGTDAYKLKLTLKNGNSRTIYIDAENFLELKTESKRTVRGTEMELEGMPSDYKEVEGVMYPFTMENGAKDSPQKSKLSIEKIEVNPELAASDFAMPAATEASGDSAAAKSATGTTAKPSAATEAKKATTKKPAKPADKP
jgi:outer membrane lipoprotein-sorting protein